MFRYLVLYWSSSRRFIWCKYNIVHDVYIYRVYNVLIGRNIADNFVGMLVCTILLCCNVFILQLHPTFNVSKSKWVYEYFFHSHLNKFNVMNVPNNCARLFIYSIHLSTLCFVIELRQTFYDKIFIWKGDRYIHWVYNKYI